jgi:hypothetical protein
MAEQSTLSSFAWVTWNETYFVVGSVGGSGGFAGGGGRASLDPDLTLQLPGAEGAA